MRAHSRAVVAFIAGRLISGKNSGSVYDFNAGSHRNISGEVSQESIGVYDHGRSCHIGGDSSGGQRFSLYDYGDSAHLTLEIEGNTFKGYEFGTSSHFSGRVKGNSVSLYDYAKGSHYNYSI